MNFKVLPVDTDVKSQPGGYIYLVSDDWNDWWKYRVLYNVYYKETDQDITYIGTIKIGQFDMREDQDKVDLLPSFESLPPQFFSIGPESYYYENLNLLGDKFRDNFLRSLNDIALDATLYEKVKYMDVTRVALMRDVKSFKSRLVPLANGNSLLTSYDFKYCFPKEPGGVNEYELSFTTEPNSTPPTNVHAIIGRNGVGKTHMLWHMVSSLLKLDDENKVVGDFTDEYVHGRDTIFDHIIYLSFSAFDEAKLMKKISKSKTNKTSYSYIGLKKKNIKKKKSEDQYFEPDDDEVQTKSTKQLRIEMIKSIWQCRLIPSKRARIENAIEMLESDPVFSAAGVSSILKQTDKERKVYERARTERRNLTKEEETDLLNEFNLKAEPLCKKFSSGHSIVLLTISKLIEELEERTLVLLDEPECHLHPPLLSTFTRILSTLLVGRNGVGIVATHSPVVLQEIPSKCVWILNRMGREINLERPEIESFGENINIITKEVFSLELTNSGFHNLLKEAAGRFESFEEALNYFNHELGMQARAILRALMEPKERSEK